MNSLFLSGFRKDEDDKLAEEISAEINFQNYNKMSYKGYHLGIEAAKAVANLNDAPMLENKSEVIQQLKTHVKNIVKLINAYERIFDVVKPDVVFSNIPFYYRWGAAFHVARERKIPFYGIGIGERENSCYFVYNSDKLYDFSEGWDSFKRKNLDSDTEKFINKTIFERSQGKHYSLPHFKQSNQVTEEYRKLLSWINKDKSLVFFPVNVPSDATILENSYVFDNLYEMVVKIIQYFNNHPDYQLIIKAHPAEEQFYSISSPMQKYCLRNVLSNLSEKLSNNIFFIDYNSSVTSFDIYPLIKLGIMYTSSAAIEMTWTGKPSITVSESHYTGKGFTYEPKTGEEFYRLIEKILSGGEPESVIRERIELSKKYFLYYFFHGLIKFNLFQGNDYNSIPTKLLFDDFNKILPGNNVHLDYICSSIIDKLPIYGENRWPPYSGEKIAQQLYPVSFSESDQ